MSTHPKLIDHVTLPVTDLARSQRFYKEALAVIGFVPLMSGDDFACFGIGRMPYLTLRRTNGTPCEVHLAFVAERREQVDAFHAAGLAAGGTDHGAPGLRPDYHAHYYAAFLRDPDGHNIELVRHQAD